ncbi:MAG TPA: preprotein translocase subunit YajC [Bacteroidia bacterium]
MYQIVMMAPQNGGGEAGNPMMTFLMMGMIIVVFYFFMIRPQMKRAKEQKKFREGLKNGDKIVTIGGIHGRIIDLKEKTAIIATADNTRIEISRDAISMDSATLLNEQTK